MALFNKTEQRLTISANFADLGLEGVQPVRHLRLRKDLGDFEGSFQAGAPAHGAVMVKIGRAAD